MHYFDLYINKLLTWLINFINLMYVAVCPEDNSMKSEIDVEIISSAIIAKKMQNVGIIF